MFKTTHKSISFVAISWLFLSLGLSPGYCEGAVASRHYHVDAKMYSVKPDGGLEGYRGYPGGSVGPTGQLGLGVSSGDRDFTVMIRGSKSHGRFTVRVMVEPKKNDSRTAALERVFDLSELEPRMLDVARDDDGRVYRLNLFPRVIEKQAPKAFRAADLILDRWCFQSSQIILNDQDYLGQMGVSGGQIAWADIPGLAKIEFSLSPLTDAAQEGILNKGILNITHNKTHIRITNVLNGVEPKVLQGGPYHVWVRWMKPSQTVDQHRESWKKQLSTIRKKIESGDIELPKGTVDRMERMMRSDRVLQVSCGVRSLQKSDVQKPSN